MPLLRAASRARSADRGGVAAERPLARGRGDSLARSPGDRRARRAHRRCCRRSGCRGPARRTLDPRPPVAHDRGAACGRFEQPPRRAIPRSAIALRVTLRVRLDEQKKAGWSPRRHVPDVEHVARPRKVVRVLSTGESEPEIARARRAGSMKSCLERGWRSRRHTSRDTTGRCAERPRQGRDDAARDRRCRRAARRGAPRGCAQTLERLAAGEAEHEIESGEPVLG